MPDGVDGAATLLSLEPAPSGSSADIPEGATVMTYIVPETSSSQFTVHDSGWAAGGLFNFPALATPEKCPPAPVAGPSAPPAGSSLFLTPVKTPLAPGSLFTTPERPAGGVSGGVPGSGLTAGPPPETGLLSTPDRAGGTEPGGLLYPPAGPGGSPLSWPAADQPLTAGFPQLVKTEGAAGPGPGTQHAVSSAQYHPPPPALSIGGGQTATFSSPRQVPVFVSAMADQAHQA